MKRILSFIIAICAAMPIWALMPVSAADYGDGVLSLLSELEIMSGDPDGNLRLDDYVSRAEFTKIAVASSSCKNSVAANLAISPFPDVTYKHWAAPYVRVGVTNGIVSGYPDATFKPEGTVLYEEAVTMMLRILGYTDDDFGVSWPSGQIGLANNLDMTDGVECNAGDLMNRRQVSRLVYNTLKTRMKNQSSMLITVHDAQITEDVTVVASSDEDSAIASDEIFTTAGTYKTSGGFDKSVVGMKGDIAVKTGNKIVAFVPDEEASEAEEYIVYSVLGNKVMAYRNGSVNQIEIEDDTAAYKGKSQTTFALLKSQLELGDRLRVCLSATGDVDYVTYGKGNVAGPVTALGDNWKTTLGISDSVSVTRNGISAAAEDIQSYDIVYYLPDLGAVMAYNNKVTGIYEKATPNRDMPSSVTVSGTDYELESSAAFNKLYSGGSFEYGDTVTLLLGRNGKAADVISPSAAVNDVVGYLTATGTKDYSSGDVNTYTNYYITLVSTDGTAYDYITDRDYSESVNSVVELSFSNGYARIKSVGGASGISGKFDWSNKKIGSSRLSSNVEILDIGTLDITDKAAYAKVYGQRIDGVDLSSRSVLYSKKNSGGEIIKLILNNVTGDAYQYGIITKAESSERSMLSSYDYMVSGRRYSVSVSGKYSVKRGEAAKIAGNLQVPDYMIGINAVSGKVTSITDDKLIADNKTYKISDKVSVYRRTDSTSYEYSMISLSDISRDLDKYHITAYYDKSSESGGRIRIIVATDKED